MRRVVPLTLLLLLSLLPALAFAADPEFKLGFKALADQVPNVVGQPIEEEHYGPNGDSLQQTTTGLMVWRKADNWTAFTNGSRTWINGPNGVEDRANDERFPWEGPDPGAQTPPPPPAQPPAAQPTAPPLQPISTGPSRPVTAVAQSGRNSDFGVAEAYVSDLSTQLGMNWERLIFSWAGIQPNGPGDWNMDNYFSPEILAREKSRGYDVVPVLQFTPDWAARNPGEGQRSVPRNLSNPWNSDNPWGQFAWKIASHYKGRIDKWIIWNEPEFKPGDPGAGQSFTWFGSDEEYYMLLKRAYQAIKAANPSATVIFGGTSYWVDVNQGRKPFFQRILDLMANDPEARANNWFFDVAAFNIYRCPDDIHRIYVEMRDYMKAKGIDKPIWLTETNAMPYDDPQTPKANDGQRVPLVIQGDYVIQSMAIASAVGYARYGWYRMTDGNIWQQQEVWGLVRDDGSQRQPAFDAFRTGTKHFNGANRVTFVPLEREDQPFGTPWPLDPKSYYPNWKIYQVAFDHPDGRRVTALWNATSTPQRVRIPKRGSSAIQVDKVGNERGATENGGWWVVDLGPATIHGPADPPDYHFIGGPPILLVERGVPANAPVEEPRLGDPGSAQPGLALSLDPASHKFRAGETVRFTLRLRGVEGFNSQVRLSIADLPKGAQVDVPSTAYPGERVQVTVRTDRSLEPNLYVLKLQATGGGVTATTDLVLEVPS